MTSTHTDSTDTTSSPASNPSTAPQGRGATTSVFTAGLVATLAGLALTAVDQFALGLLDQHQHQLYDPVGKSGQAGPLYGYLYSLGILGALGWTLCLRKVRRGAPSARRWSWTTLILAAFAVAPLLLTEYGQLVIPLQLGALPMLAWLLGLVGTVLLRRPKAGPQSTAGRTA